MKFVLIFIMIMTVVIAQKIEEKEDLIPAESQSYGFGYGTKIADKYGGRSTVYVHGFGVDDHDDVHDYHRRIYGHRNKYNSVTDQYGYGYINEFGQAKHGYGFSKYGGHHYDSVAAKARFPVVDGHPIPASPFPGFRGAGYPYQYPTYIHGSATASASAHAGYGFGYGHF